MRSAAEPVRRTAAFRLFSSCPATSSATFGRASKFAPTTPIGMRRSVTTRPLSSVRLPISRSSGSQRRRRDHLALERVEPPVVEAEPVERALVEVPGRRLDVGVVGGEHLRAPLAQYHGRLRQRGRDRVVGQRGGGSTRGPGLVFDLFTYCHFSMYSRFCERAIPAHIKRG